MKKMFVLMIMLSACSSVKTVKKGSIKCTYNPKIWSVQDLTVEDSLKLDSLIKLNQ